MFSINHQTWISCYHLIRSITIIRSQQQNKSNAALIHIVCSYPKRIHHGYRIDRRVREHYVGVDPRSHRKRLSWVDGICGEQQSKEEKCRRWLYNPGVWYPTIFVSYPFNTSVDNQFTLFAYEGEGMAPTGESPSSQGLILVNPTTTPLPTG